MTPDISTPPLTRHNNKKKEERATHYIAGVCPLFLSSKVGGALFSDAAAQLHGLAKLL